jgi:hypothetical protein
MQPDVQRVRSADTISQGSKDGEQIMSESIGLPLTARHRDALDWLLGLLRLGPPAPPPPWSRSTYARQPLVHSRLMLMRPTIFTSARTEGETLHASFLDRRGQPFVIRLAFERELLVSHAYGWPLAPDLELSEVGIEAAEIVAAIERDAAIVLGDGRTLKVHRPKLGDFLRLQDDTRMALIRRAGKPVAARVWALRDVSEAGSRYRVGTSQIARVLPEARGSNLMRHFTLWESEVVEPMVRAEVAYIDVGNAAVTASFQTRDFEWTRRVLELTFDCGAIAGPPAGRPAQPGDAGLIAALAQAAHGREALHFPRDAAEIARRLERAPDVYGWGDVLIGEEAMLGVWASLDESETTAPGAPSTPAVRRVMAVALDHGWRGEAGADAFLALLRAQAARVRASGATHLVLYTWPGSEVDRRCARLAGQIAEVAIQTDLKEPSDRVGAYTDPLYL